VRIVVTGGTGFVGRALVASLAERGDEVVVLSRGGRESTSPGRTTRPGSVTLATWTPSATGEWTRRLDGADAVVHLAGAGIMDERWTPLRMDVLRSSRIRSTELVAEAISRAERKPRVLVSGSAVGYYGTQTEDRAVPDDAPAGTDFLATLCRDWEAAADRARSSGVRVCHPRTGLVLGRGGGLLDRMLPPFKSFVGGPIGGGKQYMPWVHLRDVVGAIEHAIATESLSGGFNLTAPEPVTMNAFASALGSALGRPARMRVPAFAVKLAFGPAAEALLTGQRAVPARLVQSGYAFLFPDLASALADLVAK
jgi:uncharacterized protein (TIGR01777 family)